MPVCQNKWPQQGHGKNDDRGNHNRPPRHGSPKTGLRPAGGPGEWQDRLERPKGEKEQNGDIRGAKLKGHSIDPQQGGPEFASSTGVRARVGGEPADDSDQLHMRGGGRVAKFVG
jgi:hypothetical protein